MLSRRLFVLSFILLAGFYALGYFVLRPTGDDKEKKKPVPDLKIEPARILPPNTSLLAETPDLQALLTHLAQTPGGKSLGLGDTQAFFAKHTRMPESPAALAWLDDLRNLRPGRAFIATVPTEERATNDWIIGFKTKMSRQPMGNVLRLVMHILGAQSLRGQLDAYKGWVIESHETPASSPGWAVHRGWCLVASSKSLLRAAIDHAMGDPTGLTLADDPHAQEAASNFASGANFSCFARGPFPKWTGWPNGELAWSNVEGGGDRVFIKSKEKPRAPGEAATIPIVPVPDSTDESAGKSPIVSHYASARSGRALFARVFRTAEPGIDDELASLISKSCGDGFALATTATPGDAGVENTQDLHFILPVTDGASITDLEKAVEARLDAVPIALSTKENITLFPSSAPNRRESFRNPFPEDFYLLLHPKAVVLSTRPGSIIPRLGQSSSARGSAAVDFRVLANPAILPSGSRVFLDRIFGEHAALLLSGARSSAVHELMLSEDRKIRYYARNSDPNVIATTGGKTGSLAWALALLIDRISATHIDKISAAWNSLSIK